MKLRQAVVLAGGKAMRMRPYTEDRPKAMVEVAGKPLLEHQLAWLARHGIREIVVSCGYRSEVIEKYVGDGGWLGVDIAYAIEDEPLGRGGGLKFAARRLPHPRERSFAFNGDVIGDFDLSDLKAQHEALHKEFGVLATVALAPYTSNWGVADLEGDLIRGFIQSPKLPYWINAGIYVLEPEVMNLLPDRGDHEESTFPKFAGEGKLGAFRIDGYWRGIDTVKDVEEATRELSL